MAQTPELHLENTLTPQELQFVKLGIVLLHVSRCKEIQRKVQKKPWSRDDSKSLPFSTVLLTESCTLSCTHFLTLAILPAQMPG